MQSLIHLHIEEDSENTVRLLRTIASSLARLTSVAGLSKSLEHVLEVEGFQVIFINCLDAPPSIQIVHTKNNLLTETDSSDPIYATFTGHTVIRECINEFQEFLVLERDRAESTARAYIYDVLSFSSFLERMGMQPIVSELTLSNLQKWKVELRRAGHKESTIARRMHGLLAFWRFLYKRRVTLLPPPSPDTVEFPRRRSVPLYALDEEEFLRFMLTEPKPYWPADYLHWRDQAMFAFLAYHPQVSIEGMLRLNIQDIDLQACSFQMRGKLFNLHPNAIESLQKYMAVMPYPQGPLFITYKGKRLTRKYYRAAFRRHLHHCGIQDEPARHNPRFLPPTHLKVFLETPVQPYGASQARRDWLAFQLLCWLAMRPSEVVKLRKRDVDIRHRKITLVNTKSRDDQELPIPDELVDTLADFIRDLPEDAFIFTSSSGRRWTRKGLYLAVKRHARFCNLGDKVTPRILRRSLAQILEDRRVSQEDIGKLLRHAEVRSTTTARHYALIRAEHIRPVLGYHPARNLTEESEESV